MSIRFLGVSKSFGTKVILKDFSLEIPQGQILFILGKSGMGKSVTLKHIVGLLKPDRGEVWVDGQNVSTLSIQRLGTIRRKCGMVFQQPALLDSLTVFENVAFGLPRDWTELRRREVVIQTLNWVRLGQEILERFPAEISYGMQKRVSLARTLAPRPEYLLFDEPTTGLDPITTRAVSDLIVDLSRKLRVTSVVVSHDMECALRIADQIVVLDQARILAQGSPHDLRSSREPLVREFLAEVT